MRLRFAVLALLVFLGGCAAQSSIQTISATAPRIDSGKSAAVMVNTSLPQRQGVATSLRHALLRQLADRRVFSALGDVDDADIRLEVEIMDAVEVDQTSRLMFGALAGQASVRAQVKVVERYSGAVLGSMEAQGISSGGTIFAGTTADAVELAATQIADYLVANRIR